ncbi:hypothetical protein ACWDWT_30810 [Streptomyces sp. NPDC003343]
MTASCGMCERDLEAGFLCPGDALALAERLERMPKLYDALAGFLAPAVRAATERVSVKMTEAPLPVDEAVLDLRYGGIALVLEQWRSDVQRVRGWGEPAVTGDVAERVLRAARWLGMELPWIADCYPAAGDLAREVKELESSVLSIVGALPDRGRRVGQCVAVDSSGVVCGATIRHQAGQTRLVCEWCHCVYQSEQDLLLLLHYQPEEVS